ncbi:site-specific DNA-methyltransferase, partial [Candidatus Peregrinibacteria bacterium]|nr:site-specific DNA-methyltransferase [Candidatus Peregrinibacteria bacterium]
MSNNKQKLELTWIGKNNSEYDIANIEPRILEERTDLSYGDPNTENMIIHGDNLLALKALLPEYEGKVKCIYIDPPYNTGSAFEHYDDSVEHSTWLSLMKPRLELLRMLLDPDKGSIWISIDDNESHYLKVLCDEVFGRNNFVANVVWQKKYTIANDAKWLSDNHDHVLIYARNKDIWHPNKMPRTEEMNARYKNPDKHFKGVWKSTPLHAKSGSKNNRDFSFKFKNGVVWSPPVGTYPRFSEETLHRLDAGDEIWFGKDGTATPSRKTFLTELTGEGTPSPTVWLHTDAGNNHEAREEVKGFNSENPFATPKPERLIERILNLGTKPNDLVLDSFLGSGTTAAVAHKMGRKYIGIEMGEHAYTHCKVRLDKVINGIDPGGISKVVEWKGGGGFKFYELAPSFVAIDEFG